MQLYLTGAEVSSHLALLQECGVERVAVSAHNLARNAKGPGLATWASQQRLGGLEWVLYADSVHTPVSIVSQVLSAAEVQPEAVTGPIEWYETSWLKDSDLLFLPTWDGTDPATLREYTEDFDGVMLPDSVVDNPVTVRAAKAALPRMGMLGALTGRSKGLERFDMLVSSSWWAVQKHGETQVWTGDRLVRLNNEDKELKRKKYADAMEALGCDAALILADDPNECVRLAIKSWLRLEAHIAAGGTTTSPSVSPVVTNPAPGGPPNVVPIATPVARPALQTGHLTLPVMGLHRSSVTVTNPDGSESQVESSALTISPKSLRICNTCSLSVGCPSFTPHAACSYEIPVTIRTKAELDGVMSSFAVMQAQRVLQGRFTEEVNGTLDVLLGKEIDRFMNLVKTWREIEDNRDSLKITVDSHGDAGAQMGVLSRLFGAKAGQNAMALDDPIDADDLLEQMDDDGP